MSRLKYWITWVSEPEPSLTCQELVKVAGCGSNGSEEASTICRGSISPKAIPL